MCVCVFVEFAIIDSFTDIRLFHSVLDSIISLQFETRVISVILPSVAVSHDFGPELKLRAHYCYVLTKYVASSQEKR